MNQALNKTFSRDGKAPSRVIGNGDDRINVRKAKKYATRGPRPPVLAMKTSRVLAVGLGDRISPDIDKMLARRRRAR